MGLGWAQGWGDTTGGRGHLSVTQVHPSTPASQMYENVVRDIVRLLISLCVCLFEHASRALT